MMIIWTDVDVRMINKARELTKNYADYIDIKHCSYVELLFL
jgi:hypothetical protein